MKKRFLMILIAIFAISMALFVSCGETSEEIQGDYAIEGVADIALSSTQTECDFLKGVVGWNGQSLVDVTVDSSAVKFGTVGAYEITYTLGNVSKKATVRVYGTPEITGEADYEAYYEVDLDVFAGVVGKDSFGVELEVTTNHEFNKDKFGRIIYGDHFFRYYVTDSVGNTAYLDRTYTVNQPADYVLDNVVMSVANPEVVINYGDKVLTYVVYNGEKVPASEYVIRDGLVDLSYYAVDLGKGNHEFSLSFEGGYSVISVDVQLSVQEFYGRALEGEDMLWLFSTFLNGADYGNKVVWDETENAFHFENYIVDYEYDDRGFNMDVDYFNNIIAKGGAKKMTFDVKYDIETVEGLRDYGFYIGFVPGWWGKANVQQHFYSAGYNKITIDLTKIDKNGDKYKTLFMLATHGGFFVKNIQFQF